MKNLSFIMAMALFALSSCTSQQPVTLDIDNHLTQEEIAAAGLDVYGGDCIVREDGTFCIIDLNDWPSFSRCREEAAKAIAGKVCKLVSL